MKAKLKYLLLVSVVLCLMGCDGMMQKYSEKTGDNIPSEILGAKKETMKTGEVVFSPDYKIFTVSAKIVKDIGAYELGDSTRVRSEVVEILNGIRKARFSTPELVKIENTESESMLDNDIKLLVLVDLTLTQQNLIRIRNYVAELGTVFNQGNLFVAFMDGQGVSNTMQLTDYVLNTYFKPSGNSYVYLYRSILQKKDEMMSIDNTIWNNARKKVLLTFSNEKVYNNETDEPFDPDHYLYQERMATKPFSSDDTGFIAFYASFDNKNDAYEQHEENVLSFFCENTGGKYMRDYSWIAFKENMSKAFDLNFPDNIFHFVNPDDKVYRGDSKKLTVNFYDIENDSLIASASTTITKGNLLAPIIVHGQSLLAVIVEGLFLGGIIFLMVYLFLQFVLPYISYQIFRHKYVIHYTNENMSVANRRVEQSCYLCKEPFEPGDEIVVKCQHTVHKSCWDENGYHCPEYSDRCKHGSHYYNSVNLMDSRNAPFYLKWVLMAIVSAVLAWMCFTIYANLSVDISQNDGEHFPVVQLTFLGAAIGFFLTFGFSLLTMRGNYKGDTVWRGLLRAVVSAICCYVVFFIVNALIQFFQIEHFDIFVNWIPWTVSGFIIAYFSTVGTRIVHNKLLLIISVLVGFLSMYVWSFFFVYMELDFRVLLLFSFIVYAVGLAACMATVVPRSERYFLRVQGAAKGMDIALYKWFRNQPGRVVTIGKSVDCSLQLSWDIQNDVAPVQAEIFFENNIPYLSALEPGVYVEGKPVEVDDKIPLHHGKSFTIGQTTFTYVEKDR